MRKLFSFCILLAVGSLPGFSATTLDLTTAGSSGMIGTARFYQFSVNGGTGVTDAFLNVKSASSSTVQGYNTNFRPTQYDEVDTWTKAISLSSVPSVNIGGIIYREFLLDINENVGSSNELLSLDDLRFFVATSDVLHSFDPSTNTFSGPASLIYSFSAGDWIKMDYSLTAGGGWTDVSALIPGFEDYDESLYYVYLYSKFGAQGGVLGNVDGPEEWSVGVSGAFIPAPGAILLGAIGIGFVRSIRKRRIL